MFLFCTAVFFWLFHTSGLQTACLLAFPFHKHSEYLLGQTVYQVLWQQWLTCDILHFRCDTNKPWMPLSALCSLQGRLGSACSKAFCYQIQMFTYPVIFRIAQTSVFLAFRAWQLCVPCKTWARICWSLITQKPVVIRLQGTAPFGVLWFKGAPPSYWVTLPRQESPQIIPSSPSCCGSPDCTPVWFSAG